MTYRELLTYEAYVENAIWFEDTVNKIAQRKASEQRKMMKLYPEDDKDEAVPGDEQLWIDWEFQRRQQRYRRGRETSEHRRRSGACYVCGNFRHKAHNCPRKRNRASGLRQQTHRLSLPERTTGAVLKVQPIQ